ncbi:MAG TPA: hypothetical protein VLJ21_04990 [Candidatus Binatia bacterium]|nr:hypothetical protein [Candidatus Binatia bacterium]
MAVLVNMERKIEAMDKSVRKMWDAIAELRVDQRFLAHIIKMKGKPQEGGISHEEVRRRLNL